MNLIFWRKKVVATRLECPYDEIAWFAKTGVLPLEMSRAAATLLHEAYDDARITNADCDLVALRRRACDIAMSWACADADYHEDPYWGQPF